MVDLSTSQVHDDFSSMKSTGCSSNAFRLLEGEAEPLGATDVKGE